MKLLDTNWASILETFERWDPLPIEAKQFFLAQVKSSVRFTSAEVPEALIDAGLLELHLDGERFGLPIGLVKFRGIVQAMGQTPVFSAYNEDAENNRRALPYLCEYFTDKEREALSRALPAPGNRVSGQVELGIALTEQLWLDRFLSADSPQEWLCMETTPPDGSRPLSSDAAFTESQKLVQALFYAKNPLSLTEFNTLLSKNGIKKVGEILPSALTSLTVFVSLSPHDRCFEIGLWPGVHKRINREPVPTPAPVEVHHRHCVPSLLHDMTTLLVAVCSESLKLRKNDDRLYAQTKKKLANEMAGIPEWTESYLPYELTNRLDVAQSVLFQIDLVDLIYRKREHFLQVLPGAREWLSMPARQRLKSLMDQLRKSVTRKMDPAYGGSEENRWGLVPNQRYPLYQHNREWFDVRPALLDAFAGLKDGAFYSLETFLLDRSRNANPFIIAQQEGVQLEAIHYWTDRVSDEVFEHTWYNLLDVFIVQRLIPLGCIELGETTEQGFAISITDAGLYVLGLQPEYHTDQGASEAEVIVQPNFEIVFLGAAPGVEASLGRYAERLGHGVGTLFRITGDSVRRSFSGGFSAEVILEELTAISSKPLPTNVAQQINDWMSSCRRIHVSGGVTLIRCPDAETALRIMALGGKKVERISDTIIELIGVKNRKPLEQKLRKAGIDIERFVRSPTTPKDRNDALQGLM